MKPLEELSFLFNESSVLEIGLSRAKGVMTGRAACFSRVSGALHN